MNIIFAGTPDFSVGCLQALINSEHTVIAAYCQPDRPAGRGRKLVAGPVKRCALEHGIPVHQPLSLKAADEQAKLAALKPDLMVVVAYGLILPQAVLEIPQFGCINVHASLLPRWRGAAPIQRAIEAGDQETGITIMRMDAGLDTGNMLLKTQTPIGADTTGGELHDLLATQGATALMQALPAVAQGQVGQIQPEDLATYAHKLDKQDAQIDWQLPAITLHNRIRAFNPWPVCWTEYNRQRYRLWQSQVLDGHTAAGVISKADADGIVVGTGHGQLRITQLQAPGSKPLTLRDFANGHNLQDWVGTQFGTP